MKIVKCVGSLQHGCIGIHRELHCCALVNKYDNHAYEVENSGCVERTGPNIDGSICYTGLLTARATVTSDYKSRGYFSKNGRGALSGMSRYWR